MKKAKSFIAFVISAIIMFSCNNDCKVNFVTEYNNQFGHYFGFEKRLVFENHDGSSNDKLYFYGSKNIDDSEEIKLIFTSQSYQIHFEEERSPNPELHISYGSNVAYTLKSKVYNREGTGVFVETVSYPISISKLQDIIEQRKSSNVELSLGQIYKFTITDDIACSLKQLIKIKK